MRHAVVTTLAVNKSSDYRHQIATASGNLAQADPRLKLMRANDPAVTVDAEPGLWRKSALAFHGVRPFARKNLGLFATGAVAAVVVVAARLALPWPLRAITEYLSASGAEPSLIVGLNPVLAMGLIFFTLMVILGFGDFIERLYFARFAIGTTRDLRKAAFKKSLGINADGYKAATGDMVSRLIGDTARLKAGLQGFLVHVATNGLLFLGATVVLFFLNPGLGVIFASAGVAAMIVTIWGAHRVFENSLRHREKEGKLANTIEKSITRGPDKKTLKRINRSSSKYEAAQTRLQGLVTWTAHGIFGLAVLAALLTSATAMAEGKLAVGDLIVFMMYALMLQGPIVRLTRQGTRTGKILGPGYRLVQILDGPLGNTDAGSALHLKKLKTVLKISALHNADVADVQKSSLKIRRGKCTAVICQDRIAGNAILETLAGFRSADDWVVGWDRIILQRDNLNVLAEQVRLVTFQASDSYSQRIKKIARHFQAIVSVWLFAYPLDGLDETDAARMIEFLTHRDLVKHRAPAVLIVTTQDMPGLKAKPIAAGLLQPTTRKQD